MIGRTLLHYEIVEKLGQGGMGEVYRAKDTKLGRDVALKVLPEEMAADAERRKRFEREAQAIAALKHPNIVTLHSIEEADGVHFITMEYVEGGTLSKVIVDDGLPLDRFFDLAIPVADALSSAHAKGIAHRDLKPANVVLDHDERPKVLDFGLAKLFESDPESDATIANDSQTGEGQILGTVAYMSPEQAEGLTIDARSDVFSLGVLLYEMATGKRPFQGKTTISTLSAILKDDPPSVTELRPIFPRHLGRIISRCMAKDPNRRYQNALDVRNELDGLRGEITSGDLDLPTGAVRAYKGEPPRKRGVNKLIVVGIVVVAIIVAIGLADRVMKRSGGDQTAVVSTPVPPGSPAPGAVAPADTRSIAVLPFVNMSADEENEHFADGLSEELMNVLAKIPDLRVAARTSSFHFKGHTGDMSEIGIKLNVAHILEGSVRRAGDRVKVTAQLVKAADGFHMWSETYERTLDDIFGIQEEIATEVAGAMQITLLGADQERLAERPTQNTEAYEAYLAGRPNLAKRHSESLAEAERLFREATELDPDFAEAHIYLAEAIYHQANYGTLNMDEAVSRAEPLIEKALEIDPDLSYAYALSGVMDDDFARGMKSLEKAIELDPNNAQAHAWYALQLGSVDHEKRSVHNLKAIELDPLAPVANVNQGFWIMDEDPEEAERIFKLVMEFAPEFGSAYMGMARVYQVHRNDYARAIDYYEKAIEIDPRSVNVRIRFAESLIRMGETDRAEQVLHDAVTIDPGHARTYEELSDLYRERGAHDEAIRYVMKALERDPTSTEAHIDAIRLYMNLDDGQSARKWQRRLERITEDGLLPRFVELNLALYDGDRDTAERITREVTAQIPGSEIGAMAFYEVLAGDYAAARAVLEVERPRLFDASFEVNGGNVYSARSACFVLLAEGNRDEASRRITNLDAFLAALGEEEALEQYPFIVVGSHILNERNADALQLLEKLVAEGHTNEWWDRDNFVDEALKNDPRYHRLMETIRATVAVQRASLAAEGLATP